MSGKIRVEELNSRTTEVEKIYCPENGVVFFQYDKRHRPKINVFLGG